MDGTTGNDCIFSHVIYINNKKGCVLILKNWLVFISIFILTTSILSACSNTEDDDETIKYNSYVDLNGMFFTKLGPHLSLYTEYFGLDQELQLKKGNDISNYTNTNIVEKIPNEYYKTIDQALKLTTKEPSFGASDDAIKEVANQMRSYMDTINEIAEYYSSEKFAEDHFTRGRELHQELYTQNDVLFQRTQQVLEDMTEISQRVDQKELEKLNKKGYFLLYYAKRIITNSHDIMQQFDKNSLDSGTYQEAYTALSTLSSDINMFLDYAKKEEQVKKEKIEDFAGFDQKLLDFDKLITKMIHHLDKTPPANSEDNDTQGNLDSFMFEFTEQALGLVNSYYPMINSSDNK
jgi:hypothetical protein